MSSALLETTAKVVRIVDEPSPGHNCQADHNTIPQSVCYLGNKPPFIAKKKQHLPTPAPTRILMQETQWESKAYSPAKTMLLLPKIDPTASGAAAVGWPILAKKPAPHGAQRGFEGQTESLHQPEEEHNGNDDIKRPQSHMDKKEQKGQKRPCVKNEEPSRFLRIAPVNIHRQYPDRLKSSSACASSPPISSAALRTPESCAPSSPSLQSVPDRPLVSNR